MKKNVFKKCVQVIFFILLVFFFACKHDKDKTENAKERNNENQQVTITFGVEGEGGKLSAQVDGIEVNSPLKIDKGKKIEFEATPDSGWKMLEWKGIEGASTSTKASLLATSNKDVKVKFQIDPKKLRLQDLKVQGKDVKDNYAILVRQNLKAKEIKATFLYGDLTVEEEISVTIKEGEQNLIKGEKKKITLQVAEDASGKYCSYEWTITIAFAPDGSILDTITLYTSTINGVQHDISNEQKDKLLASENIVIEVTGPVARLELGSRTKTWTSLKLNDSPLVPRVEIGFQAFWEGDLTLDAVGIIEELKIEIEAGTEKTELHISLKRVEGKVDIPKLDVFVQGDKIQYSDKVKLFDILLPDAPLIEGVEPTTVEVQCGKDYIQKVKIDEHDAEIKTKVIDGKTVWYAKYDVDSVAPNGKNVKIVVEPKNEHSEYFREAILTFKLDYKGPAPVGTFFNINGGIYQLKAYSDEATLKSSKNIYSKSKFLNLNISSFTKIKTVEINGTEYSDVVEKSNGFVLNKTIAFDSAKEEEDFVIAITPEDSKAFLKTFYKFNAKKGSEKEKASPTLYINGLSDFPQSTFISKLTNLSTPPQTKVNGDVAKVQVAVAEYAGIFLLKEIEINGEKPELKEIPGRYPNPTIYLVEKEIPINASTPQDVTIVFTPKNTEQMDAFTWKFSVLKTADLPPFPNSKVGIFSINGDDSFENEFVDYLTDASNPKYMVDENEVEIKIGVVEANGAPEITNVKFSIDAGSATDVPCVKEKINYTYYSIAKHKLLLADTAKHNVKIEIVPKDTAKYSSLMYTFKLQRSAQLAKIPNMKFYLEKWPQVSGYRAPEPLQKEYAELALQIEEDEIEKVEIGKEGQEQVAQLETFKNNAGKTVYSYTKMTSLSTNGTYEKFVIKAIPKNKSKYRTTMCYFELAGSRVAEANAELAGKLTFGGKFEPYVTSQVKFYDNKEHQYISDYGAKSVKFQAQTINPRAKIKYAFVDGNGKIIAMPSESTASEKEMTLKDSSFGIHEAEFTLFSDKPTNLLVYVVAEDGSSRDEEKGKYLYTYNPITLRWDAMLDKTKGENFRLSAYDEIILDRNIIKENKIYISFAIWKTYEIDEQYQYASHQGKPAKFGAEPESWENERWYKTDIDISSLSEANELEIAIPILEGATKCFTYKAKIKLKQ